MLGVTESISLTPKFLGNQKQSHLRFLKKNFILELMICKAGEDLPTCIASFLANEFAEKANFLKRLFFLKNL